MQQSSKRSSTKMQVYSSSDHHLPSDQFIRKATESYFVQSYKGQSSYKGSKWRIMCNALKNSPIRLWTDYREYKYTYNALKHSLAWVLGQVSGSSWPLVSSPLQTALEMFPLVTNDLPALSSSVLWEVLS